LPVALHEAAYRQGARRPHSARSGIRLGKEVIVIFIVIVIVIVSDELNLLLIRRKVDCECTRIVNSRANERNRALVDYPTRKIICCGDFMPIMRAWLAIVNLVDIEDCVVK